jgi:hypothetical protein
MCALSIFAIFNDALIISGMVFPFCCWFNYTAIGGKLNLIGLDFLQRKFHRLAGDFAPYHAVRRGLRASRHAVAHGVADNGLAVLFGLAHGFLLLFRHFPFLKHRGPLWPVRYKMPLGVRVEIIVHRV